MSSYLPLLDVNGKILLSVALIQTLKKNKIMYSQHLYYK